MRIQKLGVMLDKDYKNILVKEFSANYKSDIDRLDKPENIVKVVNDVFHLNEKAEEYLYLLCMTSKCKPISFFEVSHGTHNASLAGGREIMIRALLSGATNIVLIHNHPSGEPEPSYQDTLITKKVRQLTELHDIGFCDHIIIGRDSYFSYKEYRDSQSI